MATRKSGLEVIQATRKSDLTNDVEVLRKSDSNVNSYIAEK